MSGILWMFYLINSNSSTLFSSISVNFPPDGKTLASGSSDNTVRVWDVAQGTTIKELKGHSCYVYSVNFSPDGKTLVSCSVDNTVRVWDVVIGRTISGLRGNTCFVSCVNYLKDRI